MSEISAADHVAKVFAQAQKLMEARRLLVTAKIDADTAEKELERLNGSTSLDLSRFAERRFFECEGPVVLAAEDDARQEAGQLSSPAPARCLNVVAFESWEINVNQKPGSVPLCYDCRAARDRANKAAAKAVPVSAEVAF